jgi:ankyrin repeat protein
MYIDIFLTGVAYSLRAVTHKGLSMNTSSAPRGIPDGGFDEIHLAARNRDIENVTRLLESGVDVNLRNRTEANGDGGNTPLWFAAQGPKTGGVAVAKALIAVGADVNAICEHGTTAMHVACSWGHADLVEVLHGAGADLGIQDGDGMTPEMVARNGNVWQLSRISNDERADVIRFFDSRIELRPES